MPNPVVPKSASTPSSISQLWKCVIVGLISVGSLFRLLPLLSSERALWQFPTEDGYLTLQIARNMARGLGMTVSEGTIPTNGTQPFCTWLWSLAFRAVGAERDTGVVLVLLLQIGTAALGAYLLYRLGRALLADVPSGPLTAAVAASLWYASPLVVEHSMNGLETGTYAAAIILCILVYLGKGRDAAWNYSQCVLLGLVLGWAFWVRNDAALLILATCLLHWLAGSWAGHKAWFGRAFAEACVIGATATLVALPWLLSNLLRFGHLMPISGVAEALDAEIGENITIVPAALFEYLTIVLRIPSELEREPPLVATLALADVALVAAILVGALRILAGRHREAVLVVALFGAFLATFYGLFFGAAHFVSRFLFPLSPFLTLGTVAAIAAALDRIRHERARTAGAAFVVTCAVALVLVFHARLYYFRGLGSSRMHQVAVEWVQTNVADDTWVGAIQTGTLGFWHGRTINLDGKVNPFALEARREGQMQQYILDTDIRYLVDVADLASWMSKYELSNHFRLKVFDEEKNLAVLERMGKSD